MTGKRHDLKCWPGFFQLMVDGTKTFDYRKNDRNFKAGDTIIQHEWDPLAKAYTGRRMKFGVVLVIDSAPGLPDGYCIMQLKNGKRM